MNKQKARAALDALEDAFTLGQGHINVAFLGFCRAVLEDEPAEPVDREELAKAIRGAWFHRSGWEPWLATADAAIAYFAERSTKREKELSSLVNDAIEWMDRYYQAAPTGFGRIENWLRDARLAVASMKESGG